MAVPILVTGSHRSGTTWVGRTLALDPRIVYIHEPFNPDVRPPALLAPMPNWFQYVTTDSEAPYLQPMRDLLAFRLLPGSARPGRTRRRSRRARAALTGLRFRALGRRPLLKDPIALLSAEWLADRFGCQAVVLIRHPAAFASSLQRLGWGFAFTSWTAQPALLDGPAARYADDIRAAAATPPDPIDQAILLWNVLHHVVAGYRERHPDWLFVRHEDLADAPEPGFRELFDRLGLRWTAAIAAAIRAGSTATGRAEVSIEERHSVVRDSAAARWTWRTRLSEVDQARIREGTAEVASAFYADSDWSPPAT